MTVRKLRKLKSIINLNARTFANNDVKLTARFNEKNELFIEPDIQPKMEGMSGLYAVASLFNHSCSPNVAVKSPSFSGHEQTFVATRDIKQGEELFVSYHDESDVKSRRRYLHKSYYFWCKCPRCTKEATGMQDAYDD